MKFDDASWHYGGEFPDDLPPEAGATHIAMFVAWAVLNGLAGTIHTEDFPEVLKQLENRQMTPGAWLIDACDEKFVDEDLNDVGNAFAQSYYADEAGLKEGAGSYLADYETAFGGCSSLYAVPDTWESYEAIARILSQRFLEWRKRHVL